MVASEERTIIAAE